MRRSLALAVAVAACATVLAAPAGAFVDRAAPVRHTAQTGASALESAVFADVNRVRAQHGLAPLRVSARLAAAAAQHSREMARRGYFSHDSADGSAFWKRLERFYASARYSFWSVGENLLWSSPDVDAGGAIDMWMKSPPHRANLLNGRWREIGISAVHVTAAPGAYHGLDVTIVTADFGVRR
jgi:uncharacterized protein YkwD